MHEAEDVEIMECARSELRVIISSDTDFGMLLAAQRADAPSVILTRAVSAMPAAQLAQLLLANLDALRPALEAGAVVAVSPCGIRVRRLPLL
jgi:predicted nuclease of predicted toxin-antitoxin system